jgi:hypothetical protein
MEKIATAARSVVAPKVIGVVPAVFNRWLKSIGITAEAAGRAIKNDEDKVQAVIVGKTICAAAGSLPNPH